jgi:hypothetical protein
MGALHIWIGAVAQLHGDDSQIHSHPRPNHHRFAGLRGDHASLHRMAQADPIPPGLPHPPFLRGEGAKDELRQLRGEGKATPQLRKGGSD